MEKTKKHRRGAAATTGNVSTSPTSSPPLLPPSAFTATTPTTIVGDALQDLVYQLSNPSASSASSCPSDVEVSGGGGGVAGYQQQHAIQTSLDQLGTDISVIKTQLEKKKAKMTLVEVSDKVDQILHHLKGSC